MNYIIISPVKNEEEYIDKTFQSVISQTHKPLEWIIVNDGSRDKTQEIIDGYSAQYPWIKCIHLPDKGNRPGLGPAEAFNAGYTHVKADYDIVVNLDSDLSFETDYFEKLLQKFEEDPQLGIASGKLYNLIDGKPTLHRTSDDSTLGASKAYRKECFIDLDESLDNSICWDMVDDFKARRSGWKTQSFPELKLTHYKYIGFRQGNIIRAQYTAGGILHKFGYHPLFIIAKGIYRMHEKPYILSGLAIICGYFAAFLKRQERIPDTELINYIQEEQLKKLKLDKIFSSTKKK